MRVHIFTLLRLLVGSHSGDNGFRAHLFPFRASRALPCRRCSACGKRQNTEVKLVYGESTWPSKVREDSKLPDFKKGAITTKLWLRSFFATCYPTGEGEQGLLKIADTRYFALRGEPTTKYSGWRCPRRHAITLMAPRSKLPDFNQKWPFSSRKRSFFMCFDRFFINSVISKNLNLSQVLLLISVC